MSLLVAVLALIVVPIANVGAMALATLGISRAFGVAGGIPFKHPPREAFDERSRWAFAATVAAGPFASYLCATLLFVAMLLVGGRLEYDATLEVVPGGRADAAGMRTGDRIVSIDGTPIERFDDIKTAFAGRAETHLAIVVERAGQRSTLDVVTDENARMQVKATAPRRVAVPVGEALSTAVAMPARVMALVVSSLVGAVAKREQVTLSGPVGMVQETSRAAGGQRGDLYGLLGMLNAYFWPLSLVVAYGTRPRRRGVVAGKPTG